VFHCSISWADRVGSPASAAAAQRTLADGRISEWSEYGLGLPGRWLTNSDTLLYAQSMRDRDTIDSELRRLAAVRRAIREHGGEPPSRQVDELLDERLGHRAAPCETEGVDGCEAKVVAKTWSQCDDTDDIKPYGRKGVLRRFSLLAALPLSLVTVAALSVVMFAVHNPYPTAPPKVVPPSGAQPDPPPSGARPTPPASKTHAPPLDIVDKSFIDALKREGVPVPSHEYVMIHGHAVCDFVAHQPDYADTVRFVQRSSIWDATQSAEFAAGAIVSYCPQYELASPDEMQQASQNVLSDLHAIRDDLQGISDDLQSIPGQR